VVFRLSQSNIGVLALVAGMAIALSLISYQYSTDASSQITKIAADNVRSNAEIQANDLSNNLINKIDSVTTALEILADANGVQSQNITRAAQLFAKAKASTIDISSSYFWVDRDGTLLWADAFTNKTIEAQFNGADRSNREYFIEPRDTLKPYYSTVIESVDGVPRLYIAYPIIGREGPSETTDASADDAGEFKGVVASAIDLDVLGKFLEGQLSPKYEANTGMIDRNGMILYSQNTTLIGKDIFGEEVQSIIPAEIKGSFNDFLRQSLTGEAGSGDITVQGTTTTLAYQPVVIEGNDFAVLYITVPHTFAGNVNLLIEQQRIFNTTVIVSIGAVAVGIAFIVLLWNRRLEQIVKNRTAELKTANESLESSNERLASVNAQLSSSNEQLLQANEQLTVNDKMQREFINIAAHELRTPTQAIIGYADLFDIQPEGREEAMKAVARNALRLERLTQDILDVSRIEGKALELNKEVFNISEVISTALEDAKRRVANGDIRLVYQEPKEIMVEADKTRIAQVISNLLNNAVKFTKKGAIFIIAEKNDHNELVVSVVDSGVGIHPEIKPRLFTKFTTRSQTGTGLGLFISKSIIEAHDGTITGRNNYDGPGATFTFSLPLSSSDKKKR
jgi:signal transduction histidine kinase